MDANFIQIRPTLTQIGIVALTEMAAREDDCATPTRDALMMDRLPTSQACTLRIAQDLERSDTGIGPAIHLTVREAQRCAKSSGCSDIAYCVIAAAGLLARLDGAARNHRRP